MKLRQNKVKLVSKMHSVASCTHATCGAFTLTLSFLTRSKGGGRNWVGCLIYIVHTINKSFSEAIATILRTFVDTLADTWQKFLAEGLTKNYRHDSKWFSEKHVLIPFQFIYKWVLEASNFYNFDTVYFRLEEILFLAKDWLY